MARDIRAYAGVALCMTVFTVQAEVTVRERTGYAYRLDGQELLYTEEHEERVEDGRVARSAVTYRDPDGSVIAVKRLDFSGSGSTPDFRLENRRNGHVEGARTRNEDLVVFFRKTGNHDYREKTLEPPGKAIIDGGFDRFIEASWKELLEGGVFERPFLVPSFQRFVDFRIYLERRTEADVTFVMEPASLLLRVVGDEILVTYDRQSADLKRYEGISNIRDGAGENYAVRVEFPAAGQTPDVAARSGRTDRYLE